MPYKGVMLQKCSFLIFRNQLRKPWQKTGVVTSAKIFYTQLTLWIQMKLSGFITIKILVFWRWCFHNLLDLKDKMNAERPKKLMDQVRDVMRLKHYSRKTVQSLLIVWQNSFFLGSSPTLLRELFRSEYLVHR